MMFGIPDSDELFINAFEQITAKDVMNCIKEYLVPKNRVIFYALPEGAKEMLEQKDVLLAEKIQPQKIQISKNLTLIYKKNTEKPIISGVLYLPISEDYETIETVGTISFMANLMLKGSKKFDSLDLTEWKEDHAIDLDISMSNDGTYLDFKCLKDDFPRLQEIIIDAFNNPTFPIQEIILAKERANARYQRSLSNASSIHNEFRSEKLYSGQPAGVSNLKKLEIIQALDQHELQNIHKNLFKVSKAIVTFFGDLTISEAEAYANEFYSHIPKGEISGTESHLIVPDIEDSFVQEYDFEPVNIDLNCVAPPRDNDNIDHWTMKVIMAILNGSRGRIHKAVRGTNDLAYYGYARYNSGEGYGFFRLTSQTSVDKKDELVAVLQDQINKLKNEPVTHDEIQSSIDDYSKMVITSIDDNQLPYYMTQCEAIGLGYNYLEKMKSYFDKVTPEDIQRVANEYFTKVAIFISEPNAEVELMVQ